jgi:hypothetical protein
MDIACKITKNMTILLCLMFQILFKTYTLPVLLNEHSINTDTITVSVLCLF